KERVIVGVNDFVVDEQPELEPLRVSEASLKAQVERLRRIRRTRDAKKHARSLDQLRKGCEGDANTMPLILDAVRAKATLGEIIDVMRETFGVWEEPLLYRGDPDREEDPRPHCQTRDRKSTRLNSSHVSISYAVFCLKK